MGGYHKCWIIPQSMRDYQSFVKDLSEMDKKILETVEQQRVVEARLADRSNRPDGEKTKDEVDRQLRDQLARLKSIEKQLRTKYNFVYELKGHIDDSLSHIDEVAEDIRRAVNIRDIKIPTRNCAPFMPGSSKDQPPRRNSCREDSSHAIEKRDEKHEEVTDEDKADEREDGEKDKSDIDEDETSPNFMKLEK